MDSANVKEQAGLSRRDFLKLSGAGFASLALAPLPRPLPPEDQPPTDKWKEKYFNLRDRISLLSASETEKQDLLARLTEIEIVEDVHHRLMAAAGVPAYSNINDSTAPILERYRQLHGGLDWYMPISFNLFFLAHIWRVHTVAREVELLTIGKRNLTAIRETFDRVEAEINQPDPWAGIQLEDYRRMGSKKSAQRKLEIRAAETRFDDPRRDRAYRRDRQTVATAAAWMGLADPLEIIFTGESYRSSQPQLPAGYDGVYYDDRRLRPEDQSTDRIVVAEDSQLEFHEFTHYTDLKFNPDLIEYFDPEEIVEILWRRAEAILDPIVGRDYPGNLPTILTNAARYAAGASAESDPGTASWFDHSISGYPDWLWARRRPVGSSDETIFFPKTKLAFNAGRVEPNVTTGLATITGLATFIRSNQPWLEAVKQNSPVWGVILTELEKSGVLAEQLLDDPQLLTILVGDSPVGHYVIYIMGEALFSLAQLTIAKLVFEGRAKEIDKFLSAVEQRQLRERIFRWMEKCDKELLANGVAASRSYSDDYPNPYLKYQQAVARGLRRRIS